MGWAIFMDIFRLRWSVPFTTKIHLLFLIWNIFSCIVASLHGVFTPFYSFYSTRFQVQVASEHEEGNTNLPRNEYLPPGLDVNNEQLAWLKANCQDWLNANSTAFPVNTIMSVTLEYFLWFCSTSQPLGDQDVVYRFTFSNSIRKYPFWAVNGKKWQKTEFLNRGFRGRKIDWNKFQEQKVTIIGDVCIFRLCLSS